MRDFGGKLAVITGAGTGMGRELAKQLSAGGCSVAICDVIADTLEATAEACRASAPAGTRVTSHLCDVADETQVLAFRDAVLAEHGTDHVHLLFNNAGIGGPGSFLNEPREQWERTFGVCWFGVYYCTRAFLPLLVAADAACLVNTSSVNGFWACLGPQTPHTSYSAAKFAVKGLTEALRVDMRVNAPHVEVFLVMPGHVGTDIANNTRKVLGRPRPAEMGAEELAEVRARLARTGQAADALSDDQLRAAIQKRADDFRDRAPVSAADAAGIILDGVRAGQWRILVGEDAKALDAAVRRVPEQAYDASFLAELAGHFGVRR